MKLSIPNKYVIIVILVTILSVFLLGQYIGRKKIDNQNKATISALISQNKNYVYEIDGLKKYAIEKEQMILSQKEAINLGLIEKKELKKLNIKLVNEVTKLKAQIDIILDSVPNTGTIIISQPCDMIKQKPSIQLPFTFAEKNKYLNLAGGFDINGKMNLNINIPLTVDVWATIGRKTNTAMAVVTTDNPYMKFIDVSSVNMDILKLKRWGIGAFVGYGINSKNPMQPCVVVGLGINYNLIRF